MEARSEIDTSAINESMIPDDCFCPITCEIMEDPVLASDGHTYERAAICEWFAGGHQTSPKTGAKLASTELIPNYTMRSLIQELKEKIPALASHESNIKSIEAALRLREEEIKILLREKDNLLNQANQEIKKRIAVEKELESLSKQTARLSLPAETKVNVAPASQSSNPVSYHKDLIQAVSNGRLEVVERLVAKGASLDQKDDAGDPILLVAVWNGNLEMVEWLLAHGASINERDSYGTPALHRASYKGNLEMVQLLVAKGASLFAKDNKGRTPLFWAVLNCRLEVVNWLLAKGASSNQKDNNGDTALLYAAEKNRFDMVQFLVKQGASVNEKNNAG